MLFHSDKYMYMLHVVLQVMFDSDPAPRPNTNAKEMSQAMIRGLTSLIRFPKLKITFFT